MGEQISPLSYKFAFGGSDYKKWNIITSDPALTNGTEKEKQLTCKKIRPGFEISTSQAESTWFIWNSAWGIMIVKGLLRIEVISSSSEGTIAPTSPYFRSKV